MNFSNILSVFIMLLFLGLLIFAATKKYRIKKHNKVVVATVTGKELAGKYSVRQGKHRDIRDCHVYTFSYDENGEIKTITSDVSDDNWHEGEKVKLAISKTGEIYYDLNYSYVLIYIFFACIILAAGMELFIL